MVSGTGKKSFISLAVVKIFSLFQHHLDEIIKTEIHASFEGDTFIFQRILT